MLKKILALSLVLIMVLVCMSACGSKTLTTADVQKAGKLVIGTSPDFPPFESLNNGKVEGIEIEIMELICDELGVELEIKQMDFDSVLPGVQAGKFDVGVSGISVTPDREKNTLFTTPYCLAAQAIVVTADSPIASKADLTGKTVSVQTGTTAEEFCLGNGYTVKAYQANADAELALTTGKVDAWVVDNLTAMQMVQEGDGLVVLEEKMTEEPYAFAFAKGSEDLVAEINKSLEKLINNGTVENIFTDFGEAYSKP